MSGDLAFFVSSLVVLVDCCEWVCNRRARVVNARVRNLVCDCYDISLWCVHSLMFCFSHVVLGISWDRRLFVPRRYGSMIRCCLSFWFALRGVCWHLSLADTCGIRGIRLFFWGGGGVPPTVEEQGSVPYIRQNCSLFLFWSAWDQGSRWALPAANCISRFSLGGVGPGGIRAAWDQGAESEH